MPREYDSYEGANSRQRDFVLNINEFAHIKNKTDGSIKCAVGPFSTSLSQSEVPVLFNTVTKRFDECEDYDKAKQLFISAPEGWYIVLKNPVSNGVRPEKGKQNQTPNDILVGKKINIIGPTTFALFPGQMAKTVQGHRLRSNQYLLARVYDAEAANESIVTATDSKGKEVEIKEKYFPGQLMIIKGTKYSFYIPPTGIEVVPVGGKGDSYIRDAVTLERLEYCILKNENGNKRYVHGPEVVFPEPTETFITTTKGGHAFKAIELSPISGIYVKVIAAYDEDVKGTKQHHPIGEELFITGNEQMIYYPRPEHAIISYDGKYVHHAIAIPKGEGRYVMNRETGEITTVFGPAMFLPDPRTQVIIKRKLTAKQCKLWYPENNDVLEFNAALNEKSVEKSVAKTLSDAMFNTTCSTMDAASMDILEATANISRGISYTKPRTITLDNKYDGVVAIDVWTGYAVNVVSKTGKREVVIGPNTRLLDYDESLEVIELSTGKPKTTDHIMQTVYLRVENNKVSDIINVQTKDFVNVQIKVSYCVNFLDDYKDKWFSVENYVKYLCDHMRSLVKREVKKYEIEEFYSNSSDIIRNIILDIDAQENIVGRIFPENGMFVHEVEVLSVAVEDDIAELLNNHQADIIEKNLELSAAKKRMTMVEQLNEFKRKEETLENDFIKLKSKLETEKQLERIAQAKEIEAKNAEKERQKILNELGNQEKISAIQDAARKRTEADNEATIAYKNKLLEIEIKRSEARAKALDDAMKSITPELIAALQSNANAQMLDSLAQHMAPYALASGDESITDVTERLLKGTPIEGIIKQIADGSASE